MEKYFQDPESEGNDLPYPEDWDVDTFFDLIGTDGIFVDGDWIESKDQDPKGEVRLIQLADIGDGNFKNKSQRFLTKQKAVELNCTFLSPGDLLISRLGDPLGKCCIFPGDPKTSITAVDVCIVRPGNNKADTKWLMYAINSPDFRERINRFKRGTTRARVSRKNLATLHIPLPTLAEQQCIISCIEAILMQVNAARDRLNRVSLIMKKFRQGVLAAACFGRLTEGWREENPDIISSYQEFNIQELLSESMINGKSVSDDINGFPVLRLSAVKKGRIDIKDRKCGGWSREDASRFLINFGDFFVVRGNGSLNLVGRGGLVDNNSDPVAFPDTLIRLRFKKELILSEWLALVWDSPPVRDQIEQLAHTTAGIHKISQKDISKITVVVPSLAEQHEIVRRVGALFERADAIEREVAAATKRTEALTQAVLGKAFRGELVPPGIVEG